MILKLIVRNMVRDLQQPNTMLLTKLALTLVVLLAFLKSLWMRVEERNRAVVLLTLVLECQLQGRCVTVQFHLSSTLILQPWGSHLRKSDTSHAFKQRTANPLGDAGRTNWTPMSCQNVVGFGFPFVPLSAAPAKMSVNIEIFF